jgi:alkanesulfonate monooxygenase
MTLTCHWFLPTYGDSRDLVGGGHDTAITATGGDRPASLAYLGQIAQAAEQLGFTGVLTPTGAWCEDAWLTTAMLVERTERLKFLVAFRPGMITPTLGAQMAATFQRYSGGRLLLNVVTGGEDKEQRGYGDFLSKDERYERTDEFLTVVRGLWTGGTVEFTGRHLRVEGATLSRVPDPLPTIYFGGSSAAGRAVAARHADVYLTWGEPPAQVAEKIESVRRAAAAGAGPSGSASACTPSPGTPPTRPGRRRAGCSTRSTRPPSPTPSAACGTASPRASSGCWPSTAARPTTWRSTRTSGRASAWSAVAREPHWSAATPRSPT